MTWCIEVDDLRDGYVEIVKQVIGYGLPVAPRGQPTLEIRNANITLTNPYDALPTGVGRKLNTRIGMLEAAQLIGGVSVPELVKRIAPNIATMSAEPDGTYWGAYGARISRLGELHQLWHVVRKLQEDPDSRQAVVDLWNPLLDNEPGHRDLPCTNHLMFSIRHGRLELDVLMRSNDVFLGLAFDCFQFCQAQISVARALGIKVGPYTHTARSLHIYERDLDDAAMLRGKADPQTFVYDGFGRDGDTIEEITSRARMICILAQSRLLSESSATLESLSLTPTEQRYAEALK